MKVLAEDVFVQTGLPKYTYAEREKYDTVFRSTLYDGGVHIYLYGYSKSGKTSMWKKYLSEDDYIEIKITSKMDLNSFCSVLLEKIDPYYLKSYTEENGAESKISANAKGDIKIFKVGGDAENLTSNLKGSQFERICSPEIELTFITQKAKEAKRIIILEDFQMASESFIIELADVLKAFADDQVKVILVGIDNKMSNIINARNDITSRIATLNLDKFKKEELYEIISKGEEALNVEFSEDVKKMIVDNSFERAYILQGICRSLCRNEKITERQAKKMCITSTDAVEKACELLATSIEGIYDSSFRKMLRAATKANKNDTYRWILRALREVIKNGNGEIEAKTIASKISDLMGGGFNTASIYPCLKNMVTKQDINIFKYIEKCLYIDDIMFIFYLKWSDTVEGELHI